MPQRDEPPPRIPSRSSTSKRRENERLREDLRRSEAERQRLRRENEKLKDELEAARRACLGKRRPSRAARGSQPRRPGTEGRRRLMGRAHRRLPGHIDETYDAPLPPQCPTVRARCAASGSRCSIKKSCPCSGRSVRAFHVRSGSARSAAGACRAGIRCRPPTRSAPPRCSWAAGRGLRRGAQQAVRPALRQDRGAAARPLRADGHARRAGPGDPAGGAPGAADL